MANNAIKSKKRLEKRLFCAVLQYCTVSTSHTTFNSIHSEQKALLVVNTLTKGIP